MTTRGRPVSEVTQRKNEALALLERYERGELVERGKIDKNQQMALGTLNEVIEAGLATQFRAVMQQEGGKLLATMREEAAALEARIGAIKNRIVTINENDIVRELTEVTHFKFELLLQMVSIGLPAMLVGPAGSVKTSSAKLAAQTLGLDYYIQSVSAQTSKSDLYGYMTATGEYVTSAFRKAYEEGGVFVLDEIDAGNANVLVLLNGAISGDDALFPDTQMVPKHEDFRFIATANTFGNGSSRTFVGRNQLDAATLDRFAIVEWPIDEKLEWSFVDGYTFGDAWFAVVSKLRKFVYDEQIMMQVSPRMTIRGAQLLEIGIDINEVVNICVAAAAPEQRRETLVKLAHEYWGKV